MGYCEASLLGGLGGGGTDAIGGEVGEVFDCGEGEAAGEDQGGGFWGNSDGERFGVREGEGQQVGDARLLESGDDAGKVGGGAGEENHIDRVIREIGEIGKS